MEEHFEKMNMHGTMVSVPTHTRYKNDMMLNISTHNQNSMKTRI